MGQTFPRQRNLSRRPIRAHSVRTFVSLTLQASLAASRKVHSVQKAGMRAASTKGSVTQTFKTTKAMYSHASTRRCHTCVRDFLQHTLMIQITRLLVRPPKR